MAQATQSKQIGDRVYTVTQLPGMRAVKMFARVGRAIGPALAEAAGAGSNMSTLDMSKLGGAVRTLFASLSEDEVEGITRALLETATYAEDGKQILLMPVFDRAMQGRTDEVLELDMFALQVNYGNFIAKFRGLVAAGGAPAGLPSPSPNA